ncbi:MAG: hypothetical protein NW226_24565 [Microscillaceae bacterium]|nr:hypothetical protein [Microscillaceae bacterium]
MKKEKVLDEWLLLEYRTGKKEALNKLAKRWYPKLSRQIYLIVWGYTYTFTIGVKSSKP